MPKGWPYCCYCDEPLFRTDGSEPMTYAKRMCEGCRLTRHKAARRAHSLVAAAQNLRDGRRLNYPGWQRCAHCDAMAEVYEHRDYAKPLSVRPACRRCNALLGPAKWSELI